MYSLLIDTHDTKVSFVLYKDGLVKDKIILESKMKHSEIAMPSLDEIISRNNINIRDINELFVVVGPGSFTGVRIGVVIAKTIAYLLNIPIITLTSLDLRVYSNESILPGLYNVSEKNGYFIGKYDSDGSLVNEIEYINKEEFDNLSFIDVKDLDYENIYKHIKGKEPVNPHLVNPIYVKQIEALK